MKMCGFPIQIIIGNWPDEAIESVHNLIILHNDNTDTAHTGAALVRRLEIYHCKIFHIHNI